MECRRFEDLADSYLAEELLVETNHDLIRHLESCPACREELAARRQLRTVLRSAFTCAEDLRPSRDFDDRLRARLRQTLDRPARAQQAERARWFGIGRRWALAASLVCAGALTLNSVGGGWRPWPGDGWMAFNPTPPAGRALQEVAPFAAGDHEECAVNNRQPERLALDEAGKKYDPAYVGLVAALQRDSVSGAQLVDVVGGHSCVFQGRRFGHVMVTHAGRLASVLVTNVTSVPKAGLPRLGSRETARRVNVCAPAAGFRVACFRAPEHAVFVVSDLGEQDNLALARSVAPSLQRHLARDGDAVREKNHALYHDGLGQLWAYSTRQPAVMVDDASFLDATFVAAKGL
jgi:anti-sigma factor RsiW